MEVIEEKKKRIIDIVKDTNDEYVLYQLDQILSEVREHGAVYQLSEMELAMINKGREQIKRGEYVTQEELDAEEDLWLNEE
jgi:predicted transcriptional regulator